MSDRLSVSVVIPTRNRRSSLERLLTCLNGQSYPINEVIIVDSSDDIIAEQALQSQFHGLNLTVYRSRPSVCIQRNIGIQKANSDYIFLCDDDIGFNADYISKLMELATKKDVGALSGIIMHLENGSWASQFLPRSFKTILFAFVFQHSIWADLSRFKVKGAQNMLFALIKKFYSVRGNKASLAGWPVITHFDGPVFQTKFYGLGASIIKKEWLINSPYDEVLDPHGIGDNYGVAMNFPGNIHVVTGAEVFHHRNTVNRLDSAKTYYRRILALHYFMKKGDVGLFNKCWFLWSLMGNLIFHKNSDYKKATGVGLKKILSGDNPYWKAHVKGEKCIEPDFTN